MADGAALKEREGKEGRFFTYADYKNWNPAEIGRYELIYGIAYAMARPNARHQSMLMELLKQIAVYLTGKPCKVYPAPYDVRLFYEEDEGDDTVVQPDISVICDQRKRGPEGCRGAPDFVVEILSPSNTASEMERKFKLYQQAGVREYWVLDPESNILHAHHFEDGKVLSRFYGPHENAPVETLAGLEISLDPVFAE